MLNIPHPSERLFYELQAEEDADDDDLPFVVADSEDDEESS